MKAAKVVWIAPKQELEAFPEFGHPGANGGMLKEGTACSFTYNGKDNFGVIKQQALHIDGCDQPFTSFSAASVAVTGTQRNGWRDWYLRAADGGWVLADEWRSRAGAEQKDG